MGQEQEREPARQPRQGAGPVAATPATDVTGTGALLALQRRAGNRATVASLAPAGGPATDGTDLAERILQRLDLGEPEATGPGDPAAVIRRDIFTEWKPRSDLKGMLGTKPRSKGLKKVDAAVGDYLASLTGAAPAQVSALRSILDSLTAWGKEESSERAEAVAALVAETKRRIAQLEAAEKPDADVPAPAPEKAAEPTPPAEVAAPAPSPSAPAKEEAAPAPETPAEAPAAKEAEKAPDPAPETDAAKAARYKAHVLASGTVAGLDATESEVLDVLQVQLEPADFALVAATIILNLPASVVDKDDTKTEAMRILRVLFFDKKIARSLLDQGTSVVVIPKDKKMTDLVEFSALAGTQTFDGRPWDEVRGSGGFKVPGKKAIYVAVAEENITGKDASGGAAGTSWCYAKGYSTTSHETAHVIDQFGLEAADRKAIDDLYAAKQAREANAPQEWIDGYNVEFGPTTPTAAYNAWMAHVAGDPEEASLKFAAYYLFAAPTTLKAHASLAGVLPKATAKGMLSADGTKLQAVDGAELGTVAADADKTLNFHGGQPTKKLTCYAAAHRLEYFAQTANAFLGSNGGTDPYTEAAWAAKGQPEKAKRRNGKAEAKRVEPELSVILERIFGADADLSGTNDRAS